MNSSLNNISMKSGTFFDTKFEKKSNKSMQVSMYMMLHPPIYPTGRVNESMQCSRPFLCQWDPDPSVHTTFDRNQFCQWYLVQIAKKYAAIPLPVLWSYAFLNYWSVLVLFESKKIIRRLGAFLAGVKYTGFLIQLSTRVLETFLSVKF